MVICLALAFLADEKKKMKERKGDTFYVKKAHKKHSIVKS